MKRNNDFGGNMFTWDVIRICCPSQGYFYFYDENGEHWVLYLRWRGNPWTAELLKVTDLYTDTWDWNNSEKVKLQKVYEEEKECVEVIKDSYEWLKTRFPHVEFPDNPAIHMHPFPEITEEDLKI